MSETIDQNYRGIPIPTDDEFAAMQGDELFPGEASPIPPHELAMFIGENYPVFNRIISHDCSFWDIHESHNYNFLVEGDNQEQDITEFDIDFIQGIDSGYMFFISTITNIRFLRSDYTNIWNFVIDAPNSGAIPMIGEAEFNRVIDVREGRAQVDQVIDRKYVNDSGDLAVIHGVDYIDESLWFENMMKLELADTEAILTGTEGPRSQSATLAFAAGFCHGVHNAIEMYIQVEEEKIMSDMATRLPDIS